MKDIEPSIAPPLSKFISWNKGGEKQGKKPEAVVPLILKQYNEQLGQTLKVAFFWGVLKDV